MTGLTIASWPGYGASHNAFVRIFLDGLAANGATIVSCDTIEEIAGAEADVLLLHWAERVFGESRSRWQAMAKMARLLAATGARRRAAKVVWLMHNTAPHDAKRFARAIWPPFVAALARRVDGVLTLSPGTVDVVRAAIPALAKKPVAYAWHPAYGDAVLGADARAAARAALGIADSDRVLGYCGQIRPYKGVEDLANAFAATADPDLRLYLAGRPGRADLAARLQATAGRDPRIALALGDLPGPAFNTALGVCDVVVAPLRTYLHSGSIIHALSAQKPVLTPATPFAQALRDHLGADWVRLYQGALTPEVLEGAGAAATGAPDLSAFDPVTVGGTVMDFFRSV